MENAKCICCGSIIPEGQVSCPNCKVAYTAVRLINAKHIRYMWQEFRDGKWSDGVTLQSIIDQLPTIDPVYAAGGCYCRECDWYSNESEYCSFWKGVRHPEHFCGEGIRGNKDGK